MADALLWRWQHSGGLVASAPAESLGFADIAGWRDDDHCAALACYLASVGLAEGKLPEPEEGARAALLADRGKARQFFEDHFAPFRILAEPGLLTSYFQPMLKGSRTPSPAFPIPVYRRPADLKPLPAGHPLTVNGFTAARDARDRFEPYFTRAEIEAGALAGRGLEILYLPDAIEAFIMHVQGSCRVELDGGMQAQLTFDGKNGHPYTSVAKRLIERGHLTAEDADLDGMVAWLRVHPNPAALLHENKSYIFFKELDPSEAGPKGSLGAELHPGRSLAADPLYHALGIPIWVSAPSLVYDGWPFQRLVVAQDTGSAIKGCQRGDIFAGAGAEAQRIAGRIRHPCDFIIMQPRC